MELRDLTDEQQHAVRTTDVNYPLIAGAGTGKTTTLSFRYVELLAANPDLSPREILVTTFTKRAARDLIGAVRERVLDRIATASPNDAVGVERWQRALAELDEAYVHTLHAFCQRILHEHAIDAPGVQLGFEIIDDIDATELQHDVIDTLLAETPPAVQTLRESNLTSDDGLRNILEGLFTNQPQSRQWARYWQHPDRPIDEYVDHVETTFHPLPDDDAREILADDALESAVDGLRDYLADTPIDNPGTRTERIRDVIDAIDDAGGLGGPATPAARRSLIASVSDILTTGSGDRYKNYRPKKTGWNGEPEAREEVGKHVATIVDVVDATHWQDVLDDVTIEADRRCAPLIFALAELFDTAAARYQTAKQDRNLVDYTDLIQTTHQLLTPPTDDRETATSSEASGDGSQASSSDGDRVSVGADPAAVRRHLQSQFEYVMIDEVQDTDPAQWGIVGALTALGDAVPYSRENVFIVGDEKQSIYRFRGADVAVFEATRTDLVAANDTPLDALVGEELSVTVRGGDRPGFELARNFRTLPPVLEFINGVFTGIFEQDMPDRPAYEAPPQSLIPARADPHEVNPLPEYLLVPDEELASELLPADHPIRERPAYHRRSNEARAVAARITTLIDDALVYPEDDPDADPRPATADDVAIILRKRTHLQAFKYALEAESVSYTVVQGDGFYDTPEVQTLLNLTRTLADPRNELALYGVLRSPLFGLTDDTLAPYAANENFWTVLTTASDLEPALEQAVSIIERARDRGGCNGSHPSVASWRALFEWVLDQTGYRASVSADERPRQAVANIDQFLDTVANQDAAPTLERVLDRLEATREHADYNPEAVIPDGSSGVQLMTVHAAKGDEFPIVIVPGITDNYRMQSPINNNVEFEVIDGTPELGLPVPDADNPFETTSTVARDGIKRAREARLRAEEKRILYVATTRARDHLILAGTHSGSLTDTGSLDLDDPDSDTPRAWGDFLHPILLDGDLDALTTGMTSLTRDLPPDLHRENATTHPRYRIQLPPTPKPLQADAGADSISLSADLDSPAAPPDTYQLSPSQIADLESDHPEGSLAYDSERRLFHYQRPLEDERDGEGTGEISLRDEAGQDGEGAPAGERTLYGTVFGEAVHRICELNAPMDRWDGIIEDTRVAMESDHTLTDADYDAIYEHATRAIDYVNAQMTAGSERYDELELNAELPGGELYGFIDCLLVDDDEYHIIDYKTGDHTPEALPEKTAYYQPQLDAYAAMLTATADVDFVRTTLYYTALDESHSETYDGGIDTATFERRIRELLPQETT